MSILFQDELGGYYRRSYRKQKKLPGQIDCLVSLLYLSAFIFRQNHRDEVKKAIGEAAKAGLSIVVMKPMAGAYWDKERTQPINAKAALKWVLQDEDVHSTVYRNQEYGRA